MELTPAEHVVPAPEGGWKASEVHDKERVDDHFIVADCARVYAPLQPEDEKIYGQVNS